MNRRRFLATLGATALTATLPPLVAGLPLPAPVTPEHRTFAGLWVPPQPQEIITAGIFTAAHKHVLDAMRVSVLDGEELIGTVYPGVGWVPIGVTSDKGTLLWRLPPTLEGGA
jgi:hypothetical protein